MRPATPKSWKTFDPAQVSYDTLLNVFWENHNPTTLNSQGPDFGDWELKVVPLRKIGGRWQPKETMAVTMIDAGNVAATSFEHSHLLDKLRSLVICGREFVSEQDDRAEFVKAAAFDLGDGALFRQVQDDYEAIRARIRDGGLRSVTGATGLLVQARTKGPGHGSTSRAFYARTSLVARLLKLKS